MPLVQEKILVSDYNEVVKAKWDGTRLAIVRTPIRNMAGPLGSKVPAGVPQTTILSVTEARALGIFISEVTGL